MRKKLSEKNKEGESISFLDAFFLDPETGTYPKFMGGTEDVPKIIEAENRSETEAQDTRNIFERIAGSIDGLAEGISNIIALQKSCLA